MPERRSEDGVDARRVRRRGAPGQGARRATRQTAGVERYVGLEHLDPERPAHPPLGRHRRWARRSRCAFEPATVLFGKRRAYQRKVAVADFDGICSRTTSRCFEPRTRRAAARVPAVLHADRRVHRTRRSEPRSGRCRRRSTGQTLARDEFALPPLEEQRRIADALLAVERRCRACDDALGDRPSAALRRLVRAHARLGDEQCRLGDAVDDMSTLRSGRSGIDELDDAATVSTRDCAISSRQDHSIERTYELRTLDCRDDARSERLICSMTAIVLILEGADLAALGMHPIATMLDAWHASDMTASDPRQRTICCRRAMDSAERAGTWLQSTLLQARARACRSINDGNVADDAAVPATRSSSQSAIVEQLERIATPQLSASRRRERGSLRAC